MTTQTAPLATYQERRFERKCDFELYPDTIHVAGRVGYGRFEATIPLNTLEANFDRLWVYRRLFYAGAFACLFGLVCLAVVIFAPISGHLILSQPFLVPSR